MNASQKSSTQQQNAQTARFTDAPQMKTSVSQTMTSTKIANMLQSRELSSMWVTLENAKELTNVSKNNETLPMYFKINKDQVVQAMIQE